MTQRRRFRISLVMIAVVFAGATAVGSARSQDVLGSPGTYYLSKKGGLSFAECSELIRGWMLLAHIFAKKQPEPTIDNSRHLEFNWCVVDKVVTFRCVGAKKRVEIISQDKTCTPIQDLFTSKAPPKQEKKKKRSGLDLLLETTRSYPTPRTKPPKKFDDTIDALLNKLPVEASPPAPETEPSQFKRDDIAAIIQAGMAKCWNPPIGDQNALSQQVSFKINLKPNGDLAHSPESQTRASDALTQSTVESARRALIRCAPYNLPAETYDIWKEMVLNFDPKSAF